SRASANSQSKGGKAQRTGDRGLSRGFRKIYCITFCLLGRGLRSHMDTQNARDVTCTYAAARLSDGWAAGLVTIPETGRGAASWHPKYDRVNHPTPISAKSVRALLIRRDPAITATACGRRHNGT